MANVPITIPGTGYGSDDCTAVAADVLAGKTAILNNGTDQPANGTMVNNGAVNQAIAVDGSYTIPQGYHNGSGRVTGPTLSGNATTGQVLYGRTFYSNNGTRKTGTIPRKAAATYTPGTSNQIITAGQFLDGTQTIAGDAGLVGTNIKKGVTIFGVTGSCRQYLQKKAHLSSAPSIVIRSVYSSSTLEVLQFKCIEFTGDAVGMVPKICSFLCNNRRITGATYIAEGSDTVIAWNHIDCTNVNRFDIFFADQTSRGSGYIQFNSDVVDIPICLASRTIEYPLVYHLVGYNA